jgi:hypothetical protein
MKGVEIMDWKEYVVPVTIRKDGSCISCKVIVQFPNDDKKFIGLFVGGVLGENAAVNFEKIKTKETYLKDEKALEDYFTYLQWKKEQEELEAISEGCLPFINPNDYD